MIIVKPVFDPDLVKLAAELRKNTIPESLLARIGAYCFALLLPEAGATSTLSSIEELSLKTPLYIVDRLLNTDFLAVTTPRRLIRELLTTLEKKSRSGRIFQDQAD